MSKNKKKNQKEIQLHTAWKLCKKEIFGAEKKNCVFV